MLRHSLLFALIVLILACDGGEAEVPLRLAQLELPVPCAGDLFDEEVAEGEYIDANCIQERPFFELLNEVERNSEELRARIGSSVPVCFEPEDYDLLIRKPGNFRFVPIRIRGAFLAPYSEPRPDGGGMMLAMGYVLGRDGLFGREWLFRVVASRADLLAQIRSLDGEPPVECVGVFYKVWQCRMKSGEIRKMPLLILCEIERR